ncbi:hypothetical protein C5S53_14155 [Methanophagales archaeon]|nr:hypothetical protein C5S53_14155 [Methanophagales archaeon]
MVKKEVGVIFVALLVVATLGAGVANAIVLGSGHDVSYVDIGSSTFGDFFSNDLWDDIEEVEEEEKAKGVELGNASRDWLGGGGTDWPFGYWDITSEAWKRTFSWYDVPGYWDVDWGFDWP